MKHAALIARLCEASEGSAELSREVWEALTGDEYRINSTWFHVERVRLVEADGGGQFVERMRAPCLTTSLSAAWEEAEMRGHRVINVELCAYAAPHYTVILDDLKTRQRRMMIGSQTGALAICAAILAAEGER